MHTNIVRKRGKENEGKPTNKITSSLLVSSFDKFTFFFFFRCCCCCWWWWWWCEYWLCLGLGLNTMKLCKTLQDSLFFASSNTFHIGLAMNGAIFVCKAACKAYAKGKKEAYRWKWNNEIVFAQKNGVCRAQKIERVARGKEPFFVASIHTERCQNQTTALNLQ